VIVSGLNASETYQFQAVSKDTSGNTATSETQIVVTNQRTASVFDLITNSLSKAFGWAGFLIK
jgi:hypothetical protein